MTGGRQPRNDARWMAAALALAERGRGRTGVNPNVGCILVDGGCDAGGAVVVGRGWTQDGGRPHAEAMALAMAGERARGATAYVTLEPCGHDSARGPACADGLVAAGIGSVVVAVGDPDPRTAGKGLQRLTDAGVTVRSGVLEQDARAVMAGFFSRQLRGRPHVTLKLATSLDGCIALADGTSRWITGERARAHGQLERARSDAILVGAGTVRADNPQLDVRLPGLAAYSPQRVMLGHGDAPAGWAAIGAPTRISGLDAGWLLVEGGAETAAAFIAAELVDRLLLYRAPVLIGGGRAALADIGLRSLDAAHGQWRLIGARMLGNDRMELYQRAAAPQED